MRTGRIFALMIPLLLCCAATAAKEAEPKDEAPAPIGGGKPVATTIIKRCPDGYELVIRSGGRRGCAKDIVPPND